MKVRKPKVSDQLALFAKKMQGQLGTMDDNLDVTRYVRTCVPSFNRAIILGGLPTHCVSAIHGPYGGGKSTYAALMMKSFVSQGHIGLYIDAEQTVSKQWFMELGLDPQSFFFERPMYFEEVTDKIDAMISTFDDMKKSGELEDDKALIIVIDTINKLTPKHEYEQFAKLGSEAMEKGLARYRGLMLQTWLDHMTPIIGARDINLVCLAQERQKQAQKLYDETYSVKGCQGLLYDASVRLRIMASKLWEDIGKKKTLVGQTHYGYVFKNKVGFPHEKFEFFISNGKGSSPIGYNLAKTAFNEAKGRSGILEKIGNSRFKYGIHTWHGEKQAVAALEEDPSLLEMLCRELDEQVTKQEVAANPSPEMPDIPVDEESIEEEQIEDTEEDDAGHDESPLAC